MEILGPQFEAHLSREGEPCIQLEGVDSAVIGGGSNALHPLPTTLEEAWFHFSTVMVEVSNLEEGEEDLLFPLSQSLAEDVGMTSLMMNDGRETLGKRHGIEIPPEPDKTKWPKTVDDMFRKYVRYTPALADLEVRPDHELFSRVA